MRYNSQKVAREYFLAALPLFLLQVIFGILGSIKYVWGYDPLLNIIPFNVARAYDEALGIDTPRVWTAARDREMWAALQG